MNDFYHGLLEYEINEFNEKRVPPSRSADPTNPDVRAARARAQRLGVLDFEFPMDNGGGVMLTGNGEATMWAELATLPPAVLKDRASRTDDPETKRRLLALARREPVGDIPF